MGEPMSADAWHPGLESDIPTRLWPLVTLFREENAFISHGEALELADLTGLKVLELYSLRPERLLTHALLVRVTAELCMQDGPSYEELGVNLRGMVEQIHRVHMLPHLPDITAAHESVRVKSHEFVTEQLTLKFKPSPVAQPKKVKEPSLLKRWFSRTSIPDKSPEKPSVSHDNLEMAVIEQWRQQLESLASADVVASDASLSSVVSDVSDVSDVSVANDAKAVGKEAELRDSSNAKGKDDRAGASNDGAVSVKGDAALQRACLSALIKTVGAITGHRGRMLPDYSLVTRIVVNQVCNTHGHDVIDQCVNQYWTKAVAAEGYRQLPVQSKPVIMNVKGASASGKSTIRPQQRMLSEKLGIPWEDFALISPDYWRKYLLDYASLNDDHKFGAMLTGRELEIIDKKLDRYMAGKASAGTMSHLLIDRFRFDSFVVDTDGKIDSKLLTRFGDQVYLFFMVTHPAETVSRAFERGKKTGRYKAVDDLLHHNVEAFTGMPSLFLSWINSKGKRIHFEFLDNDVPLGELPRTVAFGWNETLVILDVQLLLNVDRYKKVNIAATEPAEIFNEADLHAKANTEFIVQCAKTVNTIIFADQHTVEQYATLTAGKFDWWDTDYIEQHASAEGLLEVLEALGYTGKASPAAAADSNTQIDVDQERRITIGQWNNA